jgi:uncharacterized membrane protein YgdD (TMEM256/DUF423 family)
MFVGKPAGAHCWIATGALLAAIAVLLGAYGAHGLGEQLKRDGFDTEDAAERIAARWDPAVRYQMYHALGLVLLGLLAERRPGRSIHVAGWMFLMGIGIFSGLLYVMTFTAESWRWLGMIVPFGGLAFVAGWIAVVVGATTDSH